MNPLEADDVKNVEAAFRKWAKLFEGEESGAAVAARISVASPGPQTEQR
jgi:hypothetical protein